MERSLSAVVMVDAVAYTHMTSLDEDFAVERLMRLRSESIEPWIDVYQGCLIEYAGDGALLRFPSNDQALGFSLALQNQLSEIEAPVEPQWRMAVRIGIDFGPVVLTEDGIKGHHVNLASRLEALASPGGICLTDRAFGGLSEDYQQLCTYCGPFRLKNIATVVEVYACRCQPSQSAPAAARPEPREPSPISQPIFQYAAMRGGLTAPGSAIHFAPPNL